MDASNLQETLKAIEQAIAIREADKKRGEALRLLKLDPNFQEIIVKGYIESESEMLCNILTDPEYLGPYSKEEVLLKLDAINDIKRYIGYGKCEGTIATLAKDADNYIAAENEFRKDITAEFAKDNEEV